MRKSHLVALVLASFLVMLSVATPATAQGSSATPSGSGNSGMEIGVGGGLEHFFNPGETAFGVLADIGLGMSKGGKSLAVRLGIDVGYFVHFKTHKDLVLQAGPKFMKASDKKAKIGFEVKAGLNRED